jgi:hypothetical protein
MGRQLPESLILRIECAGRSLAQPSGGVRLHLDTTGDRHLLFQMRVLDWKSRLSLALSIIAVYLLYFAITGRCDELLTGGPPP